MVFWIAVIVAGLFAWIAVQVGFFASWILLFNMVLSAYVAIFLSPWILESIPAATDTPYGYALILLLLATATLVISYGICYACLSGRLRIEFPKIFDGTAAGVVGFLAGFLITSFVGFAIALTPLTQTESLRSLGLDASSQKATMSYLCWWCDRLHGFAGSSDSDTTTRDAVAMLLERASPPPEEEVPIAPRASEAAAPRKGGGSDDPFSGPKSGDSGEKTSTGRKAAPKKAQREDPDADQHAAEREDGGSNSPKQRKTNAYGLPSESRAGDEESSGQGESDASAAPAGRKSRSAPASEATDDEVPKPAKKARKPVGDASDEQ